MFVRSRIDKPLVFRKNGKSWTLKPHSITLIDDPTVTAQELKGCYGSRVDVISGDGEYHAHEGGRQIHKSSVQSKIEPKKSQIEENKVKSLDDILEEVNQELDKSDDSKEMDNIENNRTDSDALVEGTNDNIPEAEGPGTANVDVQKDGTAGAEEQKKTEKKPVNRTAKKVTKKSTKKPAKSTKKATKKNK